MAYIHQKYCHRCEKITTHNHLDCQLCKEKAHREKVAAWNAQTTEEKLQDLRKRVEKLERGPTKYR